MADSSEDVGVDFVTLPGSFEFFRGGSVSDVKLAYETWGTLAPKKDNVLLLTSGLSASSHAHSSARRPERGWWEEMIGPGKAIDTNRYYVVCFNSLGSCFGSTGPASINPSTGQPWRVDFPLLTIEDIAASSREALRLLGIERVKAVVGSSLGGMTSLAYALMFPNEVERLVSISASAGANTFALALHGIQREIMVRDPEWHGGRYPADQPPRAALALARKLGKLAFWGLDEWTERFGRGRIEPPEASGFGFTFEVEAFLDFSANLFATQFDPVCYMYLSRAFDLFNVAEHASSLSAALARINAASVLIVAVETDILLHRDQTVLAAALREAGKPVEFVSLASRRGHDAFLIDIARFDPLLRDFLNREPAAPKTGGTLTPRSADRR